MMLIYPALDSDGRCSVDGTGAGTCVERIAGRGAKGEVNGAGTGIELPARGGLATGLNGAGACACPKCAGNPAQPDGS